MEVLQTTCLSFMPLSLGTIIISHKFYVGGIGGHKVYSAYIHDFGSHIDLGARVGITIRLYRHLGLGGLSVCA